MSTDNPIVFKLILADDHAILLDSLIIALHQQSDLPVQVVGAAANGEELLSLLQREPADAVVVDLNMPVMNGLEVIPEIRTAFPRLPVLVLTKYSDPKFVRECIQVHEVAGYMLKTSPFSEFLQGLRAVLEGRTYMSKGLTLYPRDGAESEDAVSSFGEDFLARYNLTRREIEILTLIAQARSNSQIAESLYISPQTVGAHRKNIMRKLNITTTAGLVRFAMENQLN